MYWNAPKTSLRKEFKKETLRKTQNLKPLNKEKKEKKRKKRKSYEKKIFIRSFSSEAFITEKASTQLDKTDYFWPIREAITKHR